MPNTMKLIASYTASNSSSGTVDFNSIPSTYDNLLVTFSTRSTNTGSADAFDTIIKFNNAYTNLYYKSIRGDGSGVNYNALTDRMLRTTNPSDYTASTFSSVNIYIADYKTSNYKTYEVSSVLENNATATGMSIIAGLWTSTDAVTRLVFETNSGLFAQNSTFYLYGISNS